MGEDQKQLRAFEALVRASETRLLGFARRMLPDDPEAARDIVQEAFVRLWRVRCRAEVQTEAYLFQTVRNLCRDHRRATRPHLPLEDGDWTAAGPENSFQGTELADAVRSAVASLPEPQRAVFVLSHYEGLSYREIADALDCPLNTVASRKHLAVQTLRRRLSPWIEEAQ